MKGFDDPEIYREVLQTLTTGVYLVDRDQHVVFWNDGAEAITGYLSQEVLGRQCGEHLLGHMDRESNILSGTAAPLGTAMRDGRAVQAQLSIRHKSGHPLLVRLRAVPVRDGGGKIIGAAECFELAGAKLHFDHRVNKLQSLGCTDRVTGALSREFTETQIKEHLETFAVHHVPFSVLAIRADNLEDLRVRDGTGAVTAVMRTMAETLTNSIRPTDLLGHGAEGEFLALLKECHTWEAIRVGERLRKMVHCSEVSWWGDPISLSASMGGTGARDGDTVETIVERARAALEESISQGGDLVIMDEE